MTITVWGARFEKGYSLIQLGKLSGLGKSSIHRWETGKGYPNMLQMEQLSKALGKPISDLYSSDFK